MHRSISRRRAAFHLLGAILLVAVFLGAGFAIGTRSGVFGRSIELTVNFDRVNGLRSGDQVRLQGVRVGSVSRIDPPGKAGEPVRVQLRVDPSIARILRTDSVATITAQGMIGQPVVELTSGSPEAGELDAQRPMTGEVQDGISELTRKATETLARLDQLTEEAGTGVKQLNAITGVIARGEGSLGKLVTNDDAYRKLMEVGEKGVLTLEDLQENLESLKRSWFFSKMFDERGFYERDLVLFDPAADQFRQSLASADLFESGTAILTPLGRSRIDQAVGSIRKALRPESRLVVASFGKPGPIEESLILRLTQSQAESVRDYLERKHQISYVSLLKWRKVTAVGFGTRAPSFWNSESLPGERVDLVVTTPRSDRS